MALTSSTLWKVTGGTTSLHIYRSADTIATITGSGYFNDVTNNLKQWDVVICVSETGGTPKVDVVTVTSATGAATVTTTAVEGVTAT
jgi:DNA-binding MurR/RpiR family transcriptional regulator